MVRLALDLIDRLGVGDLGQVVLRRFLEGCHRGLWRDTELGLFLQGVKLDIEPNAEAVLRLPDGGHLRPAIAWNHNAAMVCTRILFRRRLFLVSRAVG